MGELKVSGGAWRDGNRSAAKAEQRGSESNDSESNDSESRGSTGIHNAQSSASCVFVFLFLK